MSRAVRARQSTAVRHTPCPHPGPPYTLVRAAMATTTVVAVRRCEWNGVVGAVSNGSPLLAAAARVWSWSGGDKGSPDRRTAWLLLRGPWLNAKV
jgi:hypothetical protein